MKEGRESGEAQGWAGGNPLAEQHAAHRERLKQLKDIVAKETDPRIQIWIRVKWGGERAMDVGRELGYRDGTGFCRSLSGWNTRTQIHG